jgi:hypothetical protein
MFIVRWVNPKAGHLPGAIAAAFANEDAARRFAGARPYSESELYYTYSRIEVRDDAA